MANGKLIIISTRLPVSVTKENGKLAYHPSPGGLATGVSTVSKSMDSVWVGWPGISSDQLSSKEKLEITIELQKYNCFPVFLNDSEIENFYSGYCNATIWPLFHYFTNMVRYNSTYWESYKHVNELFNKATRQFINDDSLIWVHDYQLMLLPALLRVKNPNALIGFFLHTPFPSYEIFRLLPEREAILKGLLGANLVGFHTYDYVRHFLSSVSRNLGYENSHGQINTGDTLVQTDAFPIGIDYKKFSKSPKDRQVKKLLRTFTDFKKTNKVILTVDRADYSKGIPDRLDAYELFLQQNPKYHGKVMMILLAVPSRGNVAAYKDLRSTIEQKVSRINGQYSSVDWTPISYRYQSLPFDELTALYSMADVMLVTPLRDGMNLVAKEYIATHHKSDGVLVLSEMAGVATEVPEALQVNPNNYQMVADSIVQALEMPQKEQRQRMKAMQKRIATYDISRWAEDFISELEITSKKSPQHSKNLSEKEIKKISRSYQEANKRLILLDYDGTLKSFVVSPNQTLAHPSSKVRRLIKRMTDDERNKVVIVSGRPKGVLESFFENKGLGLVAEHGGWVFETGNWVKYSLLPKKWKKPVIELMEQYTERTPGAIVEEKDFAIAWHYRQVLPELAYVRKKELTTKLRGILNSSQIEVFEGDKLIEVKPRSMHKGAIVTEIMSQEKWDFILCIGDDYTDEDMFKALPERAFTIHVGNDEDTSAKYQLEKVKDVVEFLTKLR